MSLFCRAACHASIVIILLIMYFLIFQNWPENSNTHVSEVEQQLRSTISHPALLHNTCQCPKGSVMLKDYVPKEQYGELVKRRTQEFSKHKTRTTSVLSRLLFALPNSPLQYPIQGFTVRPLTPALIPGLGLYAGKRSSYKVHLNVAKGVLTTTNLTEGATVEGNGKRVLTIESRSLVQLNKLLANVSYTSTVYHIHTGDLVSFQFEKHEAFFTIVIQQPRLPVLYDMGRDVSAHVTIVTKTFLRYTQLNVLLKSIRHFYSNIKVIVADDSFKPQNITGDGILHYIMPPAQGWFAGRNLAVSQVTTKYFLWVDDDFEFTENTKIEKLVEVMEANPELDVVGGSVQGNQFYFSLLYNEGDEDGGCLHVKSNNKFHSLPGYPSCFLSSLWMVWALCWLPPASTYPSPIKPPKMTTSKSSTASSGTLHRVM
ncbi:beta-1,4 N-acetylgalactosaminyltransferase 2-like isoform X2 [Thalassophryne amazonica]|uniref:beta-1,4 N-acetylgalactosaminyltransferase 2-like isoform X2 n=1 Tax=Thalassophryne amazonica TaxID=390379 RepID=UPI001470E2C6|nr:beta-1,4 N-acetylgalactosaminyltransferase 2-like isoform X2 [Thalassophryne amazonica]